MEVSDKVIFYVLVGLSLIAKGLAACFSWLTNVCEELEIWAVGKATPYRK